MIHDALRERELGLLPWLLAVMEAPEPDHLDQGLYVQAPASAAFRALTGRAAPPLDADELVR